MEPTDITAGFCLWLCSVRPLLQLFNSTLFSLHFSFSFVFSKWNTCSLGLPSLTWPLRKIPLFIKDYLVAFRVCSESLSIFLLKHHSVNSGAFDWIWAEIVKGKHYRNNLNSLVGFLTPLHHHSSSIRWYESGFGYFLNLHTSLHTFPNNNWYSSHLSKGCCSRNKRTLKHGVDFKLFIFLSRPFSLRLASGLHLALARLKD